MDERLTDGEILQEALAMRINELKVTVGVLEDLKAKNAWGTNREEELAACRRRIAGLERCARRLAERRHEGNSPFSPAT